MGCGFSPYDCAGSLVFLPFETTVVVEGKWNEVLMLKGFEPREGTSGGVVASETGETRIKRG